MEIFFGLSGVIRRKEIIKLRIIIEGMYLCQM